MGTPEKGTLSFCGLSHDWGNLLFFSISETGLSSVPRWWGGDGRGELGGGFPSHSSLLKTTAFL